MVSQCIFVDEDTITTTAVAVARGSLMPPQVFLRAKLPIAMSTRPAMKSQIMLVEAFEMCKSPVAVIAVTMLLCFLMLSESLGILEFAVATIADLHFDKIKENQVKYIGYGSFFTLCRLNMSVVQASLEKVASKEVKKRIWSTVSYSSP